MQLQNQYDNWKASHWNTEGDPTKTVECRECHMPLVDSTDPAAGDDGRLQPAAPDDGKHRSHRFIAANQLDAETARSSKGWEEQVESDREVAARASYEIPEIADKWAARARSSRWPSRSAERRHRARRSRPRDRADGQQGGARLSHRAARHHPELGRGRGHRRGRQRRLLLR